MRLPGWLRRSFDAPVTQKFSQESRPINALVEGLFHGIGRVGRAEALGVPAVLRGRNMICGSVSTLPLEAVDRDNRVLDHPLLRQVDENVPNVVTLSQTLEDLLFEAVAWWRITGFGSDGYPVNAVRMDPGQVSLNPPTGYKAGYLPSELPTEGHIWMMGEPVPVSQVIQFDSPNPAFLKYGQRAIRRAIALDQAAEMYAKEPKPMDYFTPSDPQADPVDDDEVKVILNTWRSSRRERSTAYVPAALTYNEVQQPTPADLQLVELQKRATLDIANALGVDPEDLGISTTSRTYQNATDRRKDRINDVLAPYMRAITDRLSMPDVTKRGVTVRFSLDDYLKADPKTRVEVQQAYIAMGVTDAAEVRKVEGLPPRAITPPASKPIQATVGEPVKAIEAD